MLKRSLHLMRRQNVDLEARGVVGWGGGGQMEEREREEEAYYTPMRHCSSAILFYKNRTTPREGTLDTT